MRLYVPEIGTQFRLKAPWTFRLFFEHRNAGFGDVMGITPPGVMPQSYYGGWCKRDLHTTVTLPEGTLLKVDRVYLRKGAPKFSSLTFYASHPTAMKKKARFWVKLEDAHDMEFDLV
jgi:hypothetical protein